MGDVKSHVVLSDCAMHGNKKGGAMASEGGAIDVLGEYTQGTCVVLVVLLRSFPVPTQLLD